MSPGMVGIIGMQQLFSTQPSLEFPKQTHIESTNYSIWEQASWLLPLR